MAREHRARIALTLGGLVCALNACLVRGTPPDNPAPSAVHETQRQTYPDGTLRREARVLVWSDGRVERDGFEREYHPNGSLEAERTFEHDLPTGLWRSWFPDGTLRSEVDFAAPAPSRSASEPRVERFWHPNGRLAAEGTAVQGVREGRWSYFSPSGQLLRTGPYRGGKRDGLWTFFDEHGGKQAEGVYAQGARVGAWVHWDEHGEPRRHPSSEFQPDGPE